MRGPAVFAGRVLVMCKTAGAGGDVECGVRAQFGSGLGSGYGLGPGSGSRSGLGPDVGPDLGSGSHGKGTRPSVRLVPLCRAVWESWWEYAALPCGSLDRVVELATVRVPKVGCPTTRPSSG